MTKRELIEDIELYLKLSKETKEKTDGSFEEWARTLLQECLKKL